MREARDGCVPFPTWNGLCALSTLAVISADTRMWLFHAFSCSMYSKSMYTAEVARDPASQRILRHLRKKCNLDRTRSIGVGGALNSVTAVTSPLRGATAAFLFPPLTSRFYSLKIV